LIKLLDFLDVLMKLSCPLSGNQLMKMKPGSTLLGHDVRYDLIAWLPNILGMEKMDKLVAMLLQLSETSLGVCWYINSSYVPESSYRFINCYRPEVSIKKLVEISVLRLLNDERPMLNHKASF